MADEKPKKPGTPLTEETVKRWAFWLCMFWIFAKTMESLGCRPLFH